MRLFNREKKGGNKNESPAPPIADAAKQRLARLEELRREMDAPNGLKRAYAIQTLLSLLWIATETSRLQIAFTLFCFEITSDKVNSAVAPTRFCRCLTNDEADGMAPPPNAEGLNAWAANALNAALHETLNVLNAATQTNARPDEMEIKREVEICLDLLKVIRRMAQPDCLDPCVRLLKMFPADLGRRVSAAARQTTVLRESASQAVGAMPPDAIASFWTLLGGAESRARRDLMPALDYITDVRAIPHLTNLLEKRKTWADGEMLGWFIVRSFGRIGSRKALPALQQISSEEETSGLGLSQEARRVIQAIEDGKATRERNELLRPAEMASDTLLRAASAPAHESNPRDRDELLRPGEESGEKTENEGKKSENRKQTTEE